MDVLTPYKFANEVLPRLLSNAAVHPETAQAYSAAETTTPLPQGPTAVTSPAVPAPREIVPHTPGAEKASVNFAALGHDLLNAANRTAVNYSTGGAPAVLGDAAGAFSAQAKKALRGILNKYRPSPSGSILKKLAADKEAGVLGSLGRGAMAFGRGGVNFARGAGSIAKPVIGGLRGGLPGAAQGVASLGRTMASSPAAAAGALAAGATVYNSLQSPIQHTGDGIRLRAPVRFPAVRLRSPVQYAGGLTGGGVRVQNPVKVLW